MYWVNRVNVRSCRPPRGPAEKRTLPTLRAAHYGDFMDSGQAPRPKPPADLRPAQLGIVFVGRVIFGHVGATLVDLAQRGFLSLDETHDGVDETPDGAGGDWLLIDRRGGSGSGSGTLRGFERTLLNGMFYGKPLVRLSGIGESFVLPLSDMRKQLRLEAVRNGWLRRWGQGKRTPRGEQLLHQIHDFRRELRTLAATGDAAAMAALTPYAMIFGLPGAPGLSSADGDDDGTGRSSHEDPIAWAQGHRFAGMLQEAFGKISSPLQVWVTYQQNDQVHAWSAPHGHQPGHSHGPQQSHGGSYGGHMGGGGHVGAGGHDGH